MKIKFTKKRLRTHLYLGLIWLVFGILQLVFNDFKDWYDYFWILMAVIYFGMYAFDTTKQYLTIENGILQSNGLFGKKIALNDIVYMRKFAGDYILKTATKELTINTQLIDPHSLENLTTTLEKLGVEWS